MTTEKRIGIAGGGRSPAAKVTKQHVRMMREWYADGMRIATIRDRLFEETGISLTHGGTSAVVKRLSWKHI